MRNTIVNIFLVQVMLSSLACGAHKPTEKKPAGAKTQDPFASIDEAEDSRNLGTTIEQYAHRTEDPLRRRLAVALGRIGDIKASKTLIFLFNDSSKEVRSEAIFSAGLLGGDEIVAALKKHLVSNKEDKIITLNALSRTGKDVSLVFELCDDDKAEVRAASLKALGVMGQRQIPLGEDAMKKIASHLEDENDSVRLMAVFALFRANEKTLDEPIKEALIKTATSDKSPEVRGYAVKALIKKGGFNQDLLDKALADPDERVGATAALMLSAVDPNDCKLTAHALSIVSKHLKDTPTDAWEKYAHTARAALETVANCDISEQIAKDAESVIESIGGISQPHSAGSALIKCLALKVSGAPSLDLIGCDPQRPYVGKRFLISRLTDKKDLNDLIGMIQESDIRVAVAACNALGKIKDPGAQAALLDTLDDKRSLIVAAAADAIAMSADGFVHKQEGNNNTAHQGVIEILNQVVDRFINAEYSYAPLMSVAYVFETLKDKQAQTSLQKLALDTRPPIRAAALRAYEAIDGISPPPGLPRLAPLRPVPHETLSKMRRATARAIVRTTRGSFTIELRPDVAPATVDSFTQLAAERYFDKTMIHRVVPNFVVQAGDPTGTGMGDPNYSLRCEVSPLPYERSTVGMALSGKDTGGSQFFIAHSAQPHLDGNYTVFGKVTSGMETVDLIEEGDMILGIDVTVKYPDSPESNGQ